jgi:hypothetical protein
MATLRIEHAIHDYDTWQKAFDSFEQARAKAGVRSFAIRQPVNDPKYLMLDLEFDTQEQAESFVGFLHDRVWSSPTSSPALAGRPQTRILDLRRTEERNLLPRIAGDCRYAKSPAGRERAGGADQPHASRPRLPSAGAWRRSAGSSSWPRPSGRACRCRRSRPRSGGCGGRCGAGSTAAAGRRRGPGRTRR